MLRGLDIAASAAEMDDTTEACHTWEAAYYQDRWWCFVCNYIMHPGRFVEFVFYKYIILQRSQKAVIPNKCKNKTSLKRMLTQFSVPSLWTSQLVNCTTPVPRNKDKYTVETSAVKHHSSTHTADVNSQHGVRVSYTSRMLRYCIRSEGGQ